MADVRVRDFVYLDVERLKSIIAQIEEGLSESAVATKGASQSAGGGLEGGIVGLLKGASELSATWERQVAETRSLHDYLYNKVESALLARDFLVRLPGPEAPHHQPSSSREALTETTFFLATGRVALNDFTQMRQILDKFNAWQVSRVLPRSTGAFREAAPCGCQFRERRSQIRSGIDQRIWRSF